MSLHYRKEFFDREYTLREAYGRLWKYARRYRLRIFAGLACGILTAGTLLPLYQVIQPTLDQVSAQERADAAAGGGRAGAEGPRAEKKPAAPAKQAEGRPAWFGKVESAAASLGFSMETEEGGISLALLAAVLVVIPLVALLRLVLVFLNQYCLTWSGFHVVADIRVDMLKHIQRQSLEFSGKIDVGQLISRSTGDPAQVQMIIQQVLMELARAPFEIAVSVGYVAWFAVANGMMPTLLIIVVGFPLFLLPVVALSRKIRKWTKRSLERTSVITSKIHELLTCVRVVKASDTEEMENGRYRELNDSFLKSTLRAVRLGQFVGPSVESVGIMMICAFVAWCFFAHVTLAKIMPMLAPLLIIYKPLKQMAQLQVQLETGRASLARIFSLLDVSMELPEPEHPAEKKTFEDAIRFEDVSFRYSGADADAVSGATFEIPRGKTVAVVGSTGSGKSTLAALLSRFYDPSSGSVKMDGTDLRDIATADLRRLVGSVMQETLLFNDTIEENIKYGTPGATHEQVVEAAKLANAHEFISAQPEGYARNAGEKGFALSGGERQRIAIARAILRNPPVLILDEATSALDTVTERLVQSALDNLMKNRTTFAIAHRLSTIRKADLILVMEHGRIVERGTHGELYAAGGRYRRLCDMQEDR